MMQSNEYQCAMCKGIFTKGWSNAEALTELNEKFVGHSPDTCDLVCDDCYKKIGFK